MITRIEIFSKVEDTRTKVKKKKFENIVKEKIKEVFLADVYTIDKKLNNLQIEKIVSALTNPVSQIAYLDNSISTIVIPAKAGIQNKNYIDSHFHGNDKIGFDFAIEIGFLPGVTDNIGNTAKEIIEDLLKVKFLQEEKVYTSLLIFIKGKLSEEEIRQIAESQFNPLIQRIHIKALNEYKKDKGMDKIVPKVKLTSKPAVDHVSLNLNDDALAEIGKSGIKNTDGTTRGPLALDLTYMKTVQKYFKKLDRSPTDIELESIAQTWSEHCKHTIFADPIDDIEKGIFKTYIKGATEKIRAKKKSSGGDFCASVFTDNSGAIEFDKDYLVTHKVETHNSPSALDPFGGAITGIVGVNRDAIGFGLGAKPIVNTYGFCLADPKTKSNLYRDANLTQKILSPLRIMEGVIEGVNSGGNCSGIPTSSGFVYFDKNYQGKPLIFVGTLGLIPKKIKGKLSYSKKAKSGDYIVVVGGRVGQDGIHGATFSSVALDSGSPAAAVQIGDPITQKKFSDAIIKEARDLNLYNSITDNGAGGLSCSVAEMAKECGGCVVTLEKVPLKYPGLEPWKIWISESQERMTLAVPKNKFRQFLDLMLQRGVEATIIGEFTNSKKCIVKYNNKTIMDIDMEFLHNGLPKRPMRTIKPKIIFKKTNLLEPKNLNKILLDMLASLNIAGFEFISMQYDHEVQGNSVLKPLQGKGRINAETTVVKPLFESKKGVVISCALYPSYSEINAYQMAASSIDTAIRNLVAAGVSLDKIALLDNFCWCSSNDPKRLWQLKQAAKACYDTALQYETPFISGKDSMFNDFKGFDEKRNPIKISVPPTLLISSIGIINDVLNSISIDAKFKGDLIYILGETYDETGRVDVLKNKKLYEAFYQAVSKNLIASAISLTRGGLGIALVKMAMAGMLGIEVSLEKLPGVVTRNDFALFSESQGRIIAVINPKNKTAFEKNLKGLPFKLIGKVADNKSVIIKGLFNEPIINTNLEQTLKAYKSTFANY